LGFATELPKGEIESVGTFILLAKFRVKRFCLSHPGIYLGLVLALDDYYVSCILRIEDEVMINIQNCSRHCDSGKVSYNPSFKGSLNDCRVYLRRL
jgi:hypothetical protein